MMTKRSSPNSKDYMLTALGGRVIFRGISNHKGARSVDFPQIFAEKAADFRRIIAVVAHLFSRK